MSLPVLNEKQAQKEQEKQRLRSLKEMLHRYSAPAADALIEKHANSDVQCFACGHRCLVKPGRDGVCRVRFNDNGTLLVPHGYVGALACDPIEKKPFFHVLPGSDALTFGMLGCDYHCGYCFPGETPVMTTRGPVTLKEAFDSAAHIVRQPDGDIAYPLDLQAVAGSGSPRAVKMVFRHGYKGRLTVIRPYYLPALRCTPDHRVYATPDVNTPPAPIHAKRLTAGHFLAIPRRVVLNQQAQPQAAAHARHEGVVDPHPEIDVFQLLKGHEVTHRVAWKFTEESKGLVAAASAAGETSAEIGKRLGVSGSYVRRVRSKIARGLAGNTRSGGASIEDGLVRFPKEHRPGIPCRIRLDADFAKLLGYYCAEGCSVQSSSRPNSWVLNFSFSKSEGHLVNEVIDLLRRCLGVTARRVERDTTVAVALSKSSATLLFKELAGPCGRRKRVPSALFSAPADVQEAFLEAYVTGDGCRYPNGKVSVTTVSRELAYGVGLLTLQLGHLPSVYQTAMDEQGTIQGRAVRRQPNQYTVVWYEKGASATGDSASGVRRKVVEAEEFYLVPLRDVTAEDFDGDAYNMEVEEEHNYLAGFFLVSNCQNWVTSQMLRDPDAVAPAQLTTPQQLVDLAVRHRAPVVASSYNEPLITSEWAVDVFTEAKARGLRCAYISNGNGTPQVLDFIRPQVDAYKVDLKTFSDRNYRQLGGVLDNVTDTIRNLKARGFWVEIVTLVVPGFSDDSEDLKRMAEFLASVDPLMPWHMTAFHPDYKMSEGYRSTTTEDLMRIVEYGEQAGLKYLYPGNLPGRVGEWENTRCHHCDATVIRRYGFLVTECRVGPDGLCPKCHKPLPGIWGAPGGHGDGRVRPLL